MSQRTDLLIRFSTKLIILIKIFLTANPLLRRLDGRIIGGESIDITEVPYQVGLYLYRSFVCGGSIISEDYILTAAHCSYHVASAYLVRAGSSLKNEGSKHNIVEIKVHEEYNVTTDHIAINDIALMKVNPPFQLDKTRAAIPLISKNIFLSPGRHATISGWGVSTEDGSFPSNLQAIKVPLISKRSCQKCYSSIGVIPKGEICAAYPKGGKDACQGDSGGPMVVGGRLAGVTSWGYGCARPGKPGVYTEVAYYRDWIKQNSGV